MCIMTNKIPFFLETSAKTGQNVEIVFQMASKILYENFKSRIEEIVSCKPPHFQSNGTHLPALARVKSAEEKIKRSAAK